MASRHRGSCLPPPRHDAGNARLGRRALLRVVAQSCHRRDCSASSAAPYPRPRSHLAGVGGGRCYRDDDDCQGFAGARGSFEAGEPDAVDGQVSGRGITAAVSVCASAITELARMASSAGSTGEDFALRVLWGERSFHRLGGREPAEQPELLTQLVRWGRAWVATHPEKTITTAVFNKSPVWEYGTAWETMGDVRGERQSRGGRSSRSGGARLSAKDEEKRTRQRLHGAEKRVATYERKLQGALVEVVQLRAHLADLIAA